MFFRLHGLPELIVCDRDPAFTSKFWEELFRLNGTSFNFSSAYHPQTDGQTEVVNRTLEMYLRCFSSPQPKEWAKWIAWAEYCYNTSIHTTTKKTPFEIVYGRPPPSLLSYVAGIAQNEAVEKELIARDEILKELRENIRLQPYRHSSVALRRNLKLSPRFFGPFQITQRVGEVAYKLNLPETSKIHPVFHVSNLKLALGGNNQQGTSLPEMDGSSGVVGPFPQAVLDRQTRRNKEEVLIHWQGLSPAEATWEDACTMRLRFPDITLEDKGLLQQRITIAPRGRCGGSRGRGGRNTSGQGEVNKITYDDIMFDNVRYSIVIDQFYCPNNVCKNHTGTGAMAISDVSYTGIIETSSGDEVMSLNCGTESSCNNIVLDDVHLKTSDPTKTAFVHCVNFNGRASNVEPSLDQCLHS
ncbi:Transposon Tf2-8 polyprotein [Vitis vinifera]|uniref:Transposon Tf2-8 polyprotein n=1 Tax=Vitis vinifera TaxID=29760 RepID=A0A438CHX0_VITVI|nr:Transposon Tf2-8 polyprotein [Vitis vinifera]